ncbi:MAG: hypothetical protein R3A51_04055 [Nannocystaceae bacterium]|nr:hypothetical protein [Myxococcales bacterium]
MPFAPTAAPGRLSGGALAIVLWGVGGVLLLVAQGIGRLTPLALDAFTSAELTWLHWAAASVWIAFNTYVEGHRGFHRGFAPRVVVRALALARRPRPWIVALAPLYCMGLVHARRRRLVASWCLLLGIVAIVVLVRHAGQPWRGIVDAGVVAGLAYGFVTQVMHLVRGLSGRPVAVDPELPRGSSLRATMGPSRARAAKVRISS